MKRSLARAALLLLGLTVPGLAGELWLRRAGLADQATRDALYYQAVDLPLHLASEDPELHYTLRPGARASGQGPYGPFQVTVGPDGDRGPSAPGEREVWVFGASTVFGVGVSDDETLPAALGRALSERLGQRVRARNFGVSAYVLPQMATLAARKLEALPPPELIVVVHTNPGRRPFLLNAELDPLRAFDASPEHWLENLPATGRVPEALHLLLLQRSAIYRLWRARQAHEAEGDAPDGPAVRRVTEAALARLEAEAGARGVAVAWVLYPDGPRPRGAPSALQQRDPIDLRRPDQPRAFYDLHPPAEWLTAHAKALAEALLSRGFTRGEG